MTARPIPSAGSAAAQALSARPPRAGGDDARDSGAVPQGIEADLQRALSQADGELERELDQDAAREDGRARAQRSEAQDLAATARDPSADLPPSATATTTVPGAERPRQAAPRSVDDEGGARELRDSRRGGLGSRRTARSAAEAGARALAADRAGSPTTARALRRALDQALPELNPSGARRAAAARGKSLAPRGDELAPASAGAPKAPGLDDARRGATGRRGELEAARDATVAGPAERGLSPAAGTETVLPVSQARAALFDAESFLHGAVQAESARVTVDVGGEALHLFVRVHDGATEVRASGAVPDELERNMRASLLGEGLRLEHFSSQSGHQEAPAEPDPEDSAAPRRPRPIDPATSPATPASARGGGKLSVRA